MKNIKHILIAGALVTAAGGAVVAQGQAGMKPMAGMPNVMVAPPSEIQRQLGANFDRLFVIHASHGNNLEVASSRLALQKSRNKNVRMVAQQLIKEHSAAQRDLEKLARSKGYAVPDGPGPVGLAVLDKLRETPRGAAFDKAYMGGQVISHEQTVVLFSQELQMGRDSQVKAHAQNKLPGILGHTAHIHHVAAEVKAPGIALRPPALTKLAQQRGDMAGM